MIAPGSIRESPVGAAAAVVRMADSWDALVTAAATLLGSSAFSIWWNRRKRTSDAQNFVAIVEQIRKTLEAALADSARQADRERQIGEKFERLYEERRKELHEVNGQLMPFAVNAERLSLQLQATEKELTETKARLAAALDALPKGDPR